MGAEVNRRGRYSFTATYSDTVLALLKAASQLGADDLRDLHNLIGSLRARRAREGAEIRAPEGNDGR
jgi:hypothetical protein